MRITPLEIRQKNFEKKLRGYDKDEVNAFLQSLSTEWERIMDENKELRIKLDQSEKEVHKLREVENSLFKTLKTAEDTGANLIDQANKAAELHLKEAEMNAEAVLSESKGKAKSIIEQAELQARELIDEMQSAIKDLEKNYQSIESQRDTLISELNNLADDIKDRLQRTTRQHHQFKLEDHLIKVKNLVRESEDRINSEQLSVSVPRGDGIPNVNMEDEDASEKLTEFINKKKQDAPPPTRSVESKERSEATQHTESSDEDQDDVATGKGSFFDQIGE